METPLTSDPADPQPQPSEQLFPPLPEEDTFSEQL